MFSPSLDLRYRLFLRNPPFSLVRIRGGREPPRGSGNVFPQRRHICAAHFLSCSPMPFPRFFSTFFPPYSPFHNFQSGSPDFFSLLTAPSKNLCSIHNETPCSPKISPPYVPSFPSRNPPERVMYGAYHFHTAHSCPLSLVRTQSQLRVWEPVSFAAFFFARVLPPTLLFCKDFPLTT